MDDLWRRTTPDGYTLSANRGAVFDARTYELPNGMCRAVWGGL
jgi:hypothetical protein